MALDELDEHEQGERVRQWLRSNALSLLLGLGAGVGALAGWQWWGNHQSAVAEKAQIEFLAFLEAESRGDAAAAEKAAATLRGDYADTAYAAFAGLNEARDALKKADYPAAQAALERARAVGLKLPAFEDLLAVRLAQVLLAQGKAQDALDTLSRIPADRLQGPAGELRGDALATLGRIDEARAAYDAALAALDSGSAQRDFVAMKRADLPSASGPLPAAAAAATDAKENS